MPADGCGKEVSGRLRHVGELRWVLGWWERGPTLGPVAGIWMLATGDMRQVWTMVAEELGGQPTCHLGQGCRHHARRQDYPGAWTSVMSATWRRRRAFPPFESRHWTVHLLICISARALHMAVKGG